MSEVEHNSAVRQIMETLRGPVAEVFRKIIPGFGELSGEEMIEAVLGNSELLHGCLMIFRKKRDAFAKLLVDAEGRQVNDEFVRLRCGRSQHDIVAMIVRTHAKRHFKEALGGDPNNPRSSSGRMYAAINEYLIHEWQVPLVPHYAPLPVASVLELGPALLDIREALTLDSISDDPSLARNFIRPANAKPTSAARINRPPMDSAVGSLVDEDLNLTPEPGHGGNAQPAMVHGKEDEYWFETLNDPLVRSAVGINTEREMREMTAVFVQMGDATRSQLLAPMSLSLPQAAVILAMAYRLWGRAGFVKVFGQPGNPSAVAALGRKLELQGVTSRMDVRMLARKVEGVLKPDSRAGA
ncbi:MAG: hypothetical protein HY985_13830 [Magnetospirillum sp.]|nr:hypothetical protein [Magnetospirillum sp.]